LRSHLEAQVDQTTANRLLKNFAGARLSVASAAIAGMALDECDQRMLQVMSKPQRIDQIWSLARAPRFRLLAFVHFMQCVGVLEVAGVTAERSAPHRAPSMGKQEAAVLLGVSTSADEQTVRRAYHKLARAVHPDLRGHNASIEKPLNGSSIDSRQRTNSWSKEAYVCRKAVINCAVWVKNRYHCNANVADLARACQFQLVVSSE
jgi:hypothetical protein